MLLRASCLRFLLCLCSTSVALAQTVPAASVQTLAHPGTRALLLYFVASDCPVSNRYFPEMERLAAQASPNHIQALYIYPNTYESLPAAQQHQSAFNAAPADARTDPAGDLVRLTGARTTPEAVLLLKQAGTWKVAYRGRIDDRYIHIGLERGQVEHHDLEAALAAVIAGKPAPPATGPAVGCAIMGAR